jgi:threonine aldolase
LATGPSYFQSLKELCKSNNLPLHMDGARVVNAAIALNLSVEKVVEHCDSVSVCLSKGLGAPVGSVVVGSKEFIKSAKRFRKSLGGGM